MAASACSSLVNCIRRPAPVEAHRRAQGLCMRHGIHNIHSAALSNNDGTRAQQLSRSLLIKRPVPPARNCTLAQRRPTRPPPSRAHCVLMLWVSAYVCKWCFIGPAGTVCSPTLTR